jgi:hypothetical protein
MYKEPMTERRVEPESPLPPLIALVLPLLLQTYLKDERSSISVDSYVDVFSSARMEADICAICQLENRFFDKRCYDEISHAGPEVQIRRERLRRMKRKR